ncbi:hypothetical protein Fmac_012431 [Flemingia macrophylla]|uniref:Uncharacterized protein n=1 Tax=Flemingia macrophylla TaxID=520843 RepID=A0ABD1MSC9_9FABA
MVAQMCGTTGEIVVFNAQFNKKGLLSSQSDYMRWFVRYGLPRIDPASSPHHVMADIAEQIVYYTTNEVARGLALR